VAVAREVLVGIVVKARDGASEILRKIGQAGRKIGTDIDEGKEKGKKALEVFERSVNAINSTMEIAKKATEMLRRGFEATVGAALAQRAETDAQRIAFERQGVQMQRIAGLVGDVLLPVILGIGDAFKPALTAAEKWLTTSKQTLGSGLIEWLRDTAQILVSGVATGTLLVTQAWSGWKQLISTVKSLALDAFSGILGGIDSLLGGVSRAAKAFGRDELAGKIEETRAGLRGMAADSQNSADRALADAAREAKAQEELERKIDGVAAAISRGIGTAASAAYARLGQETKKVPPDIDKIREAAERALERMRAMAASTGEALALMSRKRSEMYLREAAATERAALLQQALEDKAAEVAQANRESARASAQEWASAAMSISGVMQNALIGIVDGTQTVSQAIKGMFAGLVSLALQKAQEYAIAKAIEMAADRAAATSAITANAAQAASGQVAAHSSIPFVGLAIGAAAASAIFALVMSYVGKFHSGGMVPGRPGEERLAVLKAGELVVDERRAGAAAAAGFGPMGSPGSASHGSSGGGRGSAAVVRVETLLPSRVSTARTDRVELARARRANARLGWQGV
jgi:hypothetical protein